MTDFNEIIISLEKYYADKIPEAGCINAGTVKEWLMDAAALENKVTESNKLLQDLLDMVNDRDYIFIPFDKLLDMIGKSIEEYMKKE